MQKIKRYPSGKGYYRYRDITTGKLTTKTRWLQSRKGFVHYQYKKRYVKLSLNAFYARDIREKKYRGERESPPIYCRNKYVQKRLENNLHMQLTKKRLYNKPFVVYTHEEGKREVYKSHYSFIKDDFTFQQILTKLTKAIHIKSMKEYFQKKVTIKVGKWKS